MVKGESPTARQKMLCSTQGLSACLSLRGVLVSDPVFHLTIHPSIWRWGNGVIRSLSKHDSDDNAALA